MRAVSIVRPARNTEPRLTLPELPTDSPDSCVHSVKDAFSKPVSKFTNDLFGIAASGWITTINAIQYNTIKSVQYYTRPRLVKLRTVTGDAIA